MNMSTIRPDESQAFATDLNPAAILNVGPDETYATIAAAMSVAAPPRPDRARGGIQQ